MLRFTDGLPLGGEARGARAGGRPLPPYTRQRMEQLFGVSFEDVRIHVDGVPGQVGAVAFTSGSDIYFAPGHFDPGTRHGLQLIAHELTHVVQQRSGRVRRPAGSGAAIVDDPALEEEARQMGARALADAAPPFLPAAHAYHRGVTPAQRGRDMRVIQCMPKLTRPSKRTSFAKTIGRYVDRDGMHYLRVEQGSVLYHSTGADLKGKKLNVPAFLGNRAGTEYVKKGARQSQAKWYEFTVERRTELVLLNHAGNLTELLKRMASAPAASAALVDKTNAAVVDGKVTAFHNRTVGELDKIVAAWFQQQGLDGWYHDSTLGSGMKFDEVMISRDDVLSAGELCV